MATLTWFHNSPDTGDPTCLCSVCMLVITEEQGPAIRIYREEDNAEARFHSACFSGALDLKTIQHNNFPISVFDPAKPTDSKNYRDTEFVKGVPFNWHNEVGGSLSKAIMSFLYGDADRESLKIVVAYIQHHIHAPMWLTPEPGEEEVTEIINEIHALRALSLQLKTQNDIRNYINRSMKIGLDPL